MGFIECLCGDVNALLMFIYDKLLVPDDMISFPAFCILFALAPG